MEPKSISCNAENRLSRTRYYMGGYWTFLATGRETNGQFALMEINIRKGLEPPPHTHTNEDESFHVLEGEVKFISGDNEQVLKSGDFIHFPKGVTHSFKLQSDYAKMVTQVVPAGLENFFMELSAPATALVFPPIPQGPPAPELLKKIGMLQQQYGIIGINNNELKAF